MSSSCQSAVKSTIKLLQHVINHCIGDARADADPECIMHDAIGLIERAVDAVIDLGESRLAQDVAAEQQPGFDIRAFERVDDAPALAAVGNGDGEAERRGLGTRVDPRQDYTAFE